MDTINMDLYVRVGRNREVRLYNCTPHSVNVQVDGEVVALLPCGATLRATETAQEIESPAWFDGTGVTFVKKVYKSSPEGEAEINYIVEKSPEPVMLLASFISMKAYSGFPVVGIELVDPAMMKLPPEQRVVSTTRFQLG